MKFGANLRKILGTQPLGPSQILYCFVSLVNEVFYSTRISQLPTSCHKFHNLSYWLDKGRFFIFLSYDVERFVQDYSCQNRVRLLSQTMT